MVVSEVKESLLRTTFVVATGLLVGLAVINFFRHAASPTDENLFRTAHSRLYIASPFPVEKSQNATTAKAADIDSVRPGDLLLQINWWIVATPEEVATALQRTAGDSALSMLIFRPSWNKPLAVRVLRQHLPADFYRQIPPSVYVFEVKRGGASDRAGLQVGDLIYRMNGRGFKDDLEADRILRQAQSGSTIAYNVLRDNRNLTINVTLARFGLNLSTLALFFTGMLFMGTGAYVAIQRPTIRGAQLIGLGLLLVGYFIAVVITRRDATADSVALLRDLLVFPAFYFGMAILAHGHLHFPIARPELIRRKWLAIVPYVLAGGLLVALTLVGDDLLFKPGLLVAGLTILAFILFVEIKFRKLTPKKYYSAYRPILGTFVTAALLSLLFAYLLDVSSDGHHHIGLAILPLSLIPLVCLYTIGRYQLFELELRVRKSLIYTVMSALWSILIIAVVGYGLYLLSGVSLQLPHLYFTDSALEISPEPLAAEQQVFVEKLFLMLVALIAAFAGWKVRKAGQAGIDRYFYRDVYDYQRAANDIAELMGSTLTMVDLAKGLVEKLSGALHLRRAGVLFFRDEKVCCCQEAYGFEEHQWQDFCITIDQKLLETFGKFRSESRFTVDYLPADLKQSFLDRGFRYIFIIRSKNKLVGALLVGEKRAESPFTHEEISFLSTVAKQASVAIENAFLYEELAEQERMKHELAIARQIQLASLPQSTPVLSGLEIEGISVPALEVGGDYFDYLNGIKDGITVIVGDVSGKGTSAALYMSKIQGILRSLHGFNPNPRELFINANKLLARDMEKKSFVTALGATFDTRARQLRLARAGHLPLLYFNARQDCVEEIVPAGLGFGLDRNEVFAKSLEEKKINYQPGDIFLFITDGITEAQNGSGDEFGEERVVQLLKASATLRSCEIRDRLLAAVSEFTNSRYQHDDQTIVVVKAM